MSLVAARFDRLLAILDDARDVIEGRVQEPAVPAWCAARDWDRWLLSLPEETLARAEATSLAAVADALPGMPSTLRALAGRVREATVLPEAAVVAPRRALRRANERKRAQVATLAALCRERARGAKRVVDFGAGHGHLTRELAVALEIDALGVEHDAQRVQIAERLAAEGAGSQVRFVRVDALREPIALDRDDFAVGLHACGSLGDAIVEAACASGASVLLVSCCLQKRAEDERAPLSRRGREACFTLRRELLGLGNLGDRFVGIEHDLDRAMADREVRRALFLLLRDRGAIERHGDEMDGLNRRRLRHGLAVVAREACAVRGLPAPTENELAGVAARSTEDRARTRRLSLPRNMLGRAIELAVAADRACALEDRGYTAQLFAAFSATESPRNVAILATPPSRSQG